MPYSKCFVCKRRLDVPTQGHWKYCRSCLLERKTKKVLKQIKEFTDFISTQL